MIELLDDDAAVSRVSSADIVALTRAARREGVPTVPSRGLASERTRVISAGRSSCVRRDPIAPM